MLNRLLSDEELTINDSAILAKGIFLTKDFLEAMNREKTTELDEKLNLKRAMLGARLKPYSTQDSESLASDENKGKEKERLTEELAKSDTTLSKKWACKKALEMIEVLDEFSKLPIDKQKELSKVFINVPQVSIYQCFLAKTSQEVEQCLNLDLKDREAVAKNIFDLNKTCVFGTLFRAYVSFCSTFFGFYKESSQYLKVFNKKIISENKKSTIASKK
jgi:hypothetical protein